MRTIIRLMLRLVLLGGVVVVLWRAFDARRAAATAWEPAPAPVPTVPATPVRPTLAAVPRFTEPVDGDCPPGFPVKGKLSSGIYHVPGGLSYARTVPERCYATERDAEADGLRAAKR